MSCFFNSKDGQFRFKHSFSLKLHQIESMPWATQTVLVLPAQATLTSLSFASWFASARWVYRILKIVRIEMVEWEFSEEKSLITYSWETVSWVPAWPHKKNLQWPLTTVFYRSSHLVYIFQTEFNLTTSALPQLSVKEELLTSSYNLTLPGSHLHMFNLLHIEAIKRAKIMSCLPTNRINSEVNRPTASRVYTVIDRKWRGLWMIHRVICLRAENVI